LKDLIFADDARNQLQNGIQKLTDAVKTTMGPRGRTVLLQEKYRNFLTKDGVTVAKHVKLKNKIENIGASLIKEVASKTADEAGDGTTTATVLANELYSEGLKHILAGANPMEIKQGMDLACKEVLDELKKFKKDVSNHEEIEQVATISANGDEKLGKLVAKAIKEVGKDGVITVEDGVGLEDELKVTKGLQFSNGYLSAYFVNNIPKMEVNFEDACVLMYNDNIPSVKSIVPAIKFAMDKNKPLLIICDGIDEDALNTLVVNKMKSNLKICVVKSPGFGGTYEYLKDIQVMTNGNIQSPSRGIVFTTMDADLGLADKVIITDKDCTIVCKNADEEKVNHRVNELKELLETDTLLKEQIKQRIAKITGGVAVIKVQAASEVETKEKKDRVDDALGATRAAQEEGIIIGAGTALYKIDVTSNLKDDIKLGHDIVLKSIKKPFRQIIENAGMNPDIISYDIPAEKYAGYNVRTKEYGNLFDLGVIDSYKVQRVALTNAVSVAGTLLTTECIIPLQDID